MATTNTNGRALFEALPREATLASRVVGQMEAMIAQGGLGDGSRLPPERDLAAQFGVSRTVIREAVAALAARGLLEVQAGSGTVVKRPRVASIARLISLSLSIGGAGEPHPEQVRETARTLLAEAAALAAERRTEDDLDTLGRIIREWEADPRKTESIQLFLHALASSAQNDFSTVLFDVVLSLGGVPIEGIGPLSLRAILDAVRKADSKAARRAARDLFDEAAPAAPRAGSKKDRKSHAI